MVSESVGALRFIMMMEFQVKQILLLNDLQYKTFFSDCVL